MSSMIRGVGHFLFDWERVLGPLFAKELRVASRKKLGYWLRTGYVLLLLMIALVTWGIATLFGGWGAGVVAQSVRLSLVSQQLMVAVIWYQFIAMPLLAVAMLSSAIGEEADRQTLNVLLTTPITGCQIVLGKLYSRLLQLGLLMAAGLPVLALLRVYGGMDGAFVMRGTAITLGAMVFSGALTLLLSAYFKRAYSVIAVTVLVLGVLFGLLPLLVYTIPADYLLGMTPLSLLGPINPILMLLAYSSMAVNPGSAPTGIGVSCTWHVLVMFSVSTLLIMGTILRLRARVLQLAFGPESIEGSSSRAARLRSRREREQQRDLIPVNEPPLVWLGTLADRIRGRRLHRVLYSLLGCAVVGHGVATLAFADGLPGMETFLLILGGTVSSILGLVAWLGTAAMAATGVAMEKEARTLPLLLTSHLSDQEILESKATAAVRRSLPLWILMAAIHLMSALRQRDVTMFGNSPRTVVEQYASWKPFFLGAEIVVVLLAILGLAIVIWALYGGKLFALRRRTIVLLMSAFILVSLGEDFMRHRGISLAVTQIFSAFTLMAQIYLCVAVGIYCGCRFHTSARAVTMMFLYMLGVYFLVSLILAMVIQVVSFLILMAVMMTPAVSTTLGTQWLFAGMFFRQAKTWLRRDVSVAA